MSSSDPAIPQSAIEVSVVIPTHNRPDRLQVTLAGVLAQRDVDLEVIIVDDGSSAGAAEVYRTLDSDRVHVLRHEQPRRPAAARNTGIEAAQGEWIAFLDDDDLWAPDKLRCQIDVARASGARWAWTGACCVDEDGTLLSVLQAPTPEHVQRSLSSANVIPAGSSNVIARRELVVAVEGFDENLVHLPDWDMWLRLAEHDAGAALDEPMLAYVQHGGMFTAQKTEAFMSDVALIDAKLRQNGRGASDAAARKGLLHWMAWGHLAANQRRKAAAVFLHRARLFRRPQDLVRAAASLGGVRAMNAVERLAGGGGRWGIQGSHLVRPDWLNEYPGLETQFAVGQAG